VARAARPRVVAFLKNKPRAGETPAPLRKERKEEILCVLFCFPLCASAAWRLGVKILTQRGKI
jgi:hypothetical protein